LDPATRVFACGPERMLHELEQLSAAWPEGVLHMERFHARAPAPGTLQARGFEVELKDSQLRLQVAADQSLLQALQAAGFDVPCDCNEGLCGTCEVAVLAGEVDHRDQVLSPSERASHQRMMACCSRAVGVSLVLAL
jgi:ferredoxin